MESPHPGLRQYDYVMTGKVRLLPFWVGRSGELRGVPLRVDGQPNWWFRVLLNLDAGESAAPAVD